MESVEQLKQRKMAQLVNKWSVTGLLEHLSEQDKGKIAVLLENQTHSLESQYTEKEKDTDLFRKVSNIALPLVRRTVEPFLPQIEVMFTPGDTWYGFAHTAKSQWLPTEILPHPVTFNCEHYRYSVDCEFAYTDVISPPIIRAWERVVARFPDKTYHMYTPFYFTEAPIIFESGVEGKRMVILTRGSYVPKY